MASGDVEVAVIGGGAAGIAAARGLREAGAYSRFIVERALPAGRDRTFTVEAGGFPMTSGCGWLHSASGILDKDRRRRRGGRSTAPPPSARAAAQPGLTATEAANLRAALWALHERAQTHSAENEAGSPARRPRRTGRKMNTTARRNQRLLQRAETLSSSLARDLGRYAEDGVDWRVRRGLRRDDRRLRRGLDVALDSPFARIDHSGRRIRVRRRAEPSGRRGDHHFAAPSSPLRKRCSRRRCRRRRAPRRGCRSATTTGCSRRARRRDAFEPDSRAFGEFAGIAATAAYQFRPFGRPMIECYFGGDLAAELGKGRRSGVFRFRARRTGGLYGGDFARRIAPLALHG